APLGGNFERERVELLVRINAAECACEQTFTQ
ncbi:MAG: hypothetical protein QOF61_1751, partial [Acidobacteriota bacterium]|nr:hypothetical protein [Acidobacteriota bacterium]